MNKPPYSFAFAVCDPAHRKDGSYWQWSNERITSSWENAAALIHQGWPVKKGGLDDMNARRYGVLEGTSGMGWLYRVYPADRDGFGRPGRYFVVLFQLPSISAATLHEVAGILNYFETERSLPLKTAPLDLGVPPAEPDAVLQKLAEHWRNGGHGAHWGMDERGNVVGFAKPAAKPITASPPLVPTLAPVEVQGNTSQSQIKQKRRFIPGLLIGLVAGFLIGRQTGSPQKREPRSNKPQEAESRAIESPSHTPELNPPPATKNHERSDPKGRLEQELPTDKRSKRADEPDRQDQPPARER